MSLCSSPFFVDFLIPLLRGGASGSAAAGVCLAALRNTPLHPSQEGNRTARRSF